MTDYEVELKFPIIDPAEVIARLQGLGATQTGMAEQSDRYFSHPVREFAQTDEALRLRSDGNQNCLTYKGPLLDSTTKTRQEIEFEFAAGEEGAHKAWALLRALGFEDVFTVRKRRTSFAIDWEGRPFSVACDNVDHLGNYVEIETMAGMNDWEAARDAAQRLAQELSLSDSERRSYLQMLLEQRSHH
ncbi:MAG: class IV adenylate cyclase [Planctomycetaceae bacterium]